MLGAFLKAIAALIIGFIVGFMIGGFSGILVGLIPVLFFRGIVELNLEVATNILLLAVLGGAIGYIEIRITNRMFDTNFKPLIGLLIGAAFAFALGLAGRSAMDLPNTGKFSEDLYIGELLFMGWAGCIIGSVIFSVFAFIQTVWGITQSHKVNPVLGARNN